MWDSTFKKQNPKTHSIVELILSLPFFQNFLKNFFQITDFFDREQLLSASQSGYRKQFSTIDAILKSTWQIRLELNRKENGYIYFKSFWLCKPRNTFTETRK